MGLSRRRAGVLLLSGAPLLMCGGRLSARDNLPSGVGAVEAVPYDDGLARSPPERQGVSSAAILAFLADVESAGLELHGLMLMRHGYVVAEGWWWPYRANRTHITHSLTKSVTATAVGLAISERRFELDSRVADFFPQFLSADASENVRAMTVRDLLTMRTGHDRETSGSAWRPIATSWIAEFFKIPVPLTPGTRFVYTSAASYMLSAIISRTTGQSMADYLRPRLFEPLKIDRWHWDTSPGGISPGGNGLSWNTAATLKFCALHASGGTFRGNRILAGDWVRAATTKQTDEEEFGRGYGYQWWMGPGSSYFALGLFAQMGVVFPDDDACLAIFAAIEQSAQLQALIWRHFPKAFGPSGPSGRAAARLALAQRAFRLPLPDLRDAGRTMSERFAVEPNDQGVRSVSFDIAAGACDYRMTDALGDHRIVSGLTEYLEQDTSMTGYRLHHEYRPTTMRVVAGARWLGTDRMEMTWQFVESAFRDTVLCTFAGNRLTVDRRVNLNSKETRLPTLTGIRL